MDSRRDIHPDMEVKTCKDCLSSCCKPEVDVTRKEYDRLKAKGHKKEMITRTDIFLEDNPNYKNRRDYLDDMYKDVYATINKGKDGFCRLLDISTRLCTIYDSRPKVCRDFEVNSNRCKSIKKCIN